MSNDVYGVAVSNITMYSKPDYNSEVICDIYDAEEVLYLGTTFPDGHKWYKVCTQCGIEGYCEEGGVIWTVF